jgi:hypothetical protein
MAKRSDLDSLNSEFDELLETMQRPKAKKAMKAAFDPTPGELGWKAVRAAAKNASTRKARKSRSA